MDLHPDTGLHYIVAFPRGPAFQDARRLYQSAARSRPWLTEILYDDLLENFERYDHTTTVVAAWGTVLQPPPKDRKCRIARVYSEAFDPDQSNMIERHAKWLALTRSRMSFYDAVLCHTPWMAKEFLALISNTGVLPMGWDPHVLGTPDWDTPKSFRYTYAGSRTGKREWMVPAMQKSMGYQFNDASGEWGQALIKTYNLSEANLYLTHCDIQSFSTFRIWHSISSSTAFVAEKDRDCWPVTDDLYVGLPTISRENVDEVSKFLCDMSPDALKEKGLAMHEALSHFTIDHVVDQYLIPWSTTLQSR